MFIIPSFCMVRFEISLSLLFK